MKTYLKLLIIPFLMLFLASCTFPNPSNMKISSTAFKNQGSIPSKYTCDEDNVNPPLIIEEVPKGAKSLALISDDPDAPAKTWVHWIVFNMDPNVSKIAQNSVPKGIEGTTSFGESGYEGPCPPSGTHRYFFKLYALDIELELDASADKTALESAMKEHIIEQAELMGTYSR